MRDVCLTFSQVGLIFVGKMQLKLWKKRRLSLIRMSKNRFNFL